MKNKKKLMTHLQTLIVQMLIMTALVGSLSPTLRAQTNSADSSPNSATRADDEALRRACGEAVEELKAARNLLKAQGVAIEKQKELFELEQKISEGLKNLRTLDAAEKDELRKALAAKDRVITALESEVKVLKKQKFTLWKAAKVAIVAVGAGIIIGKVF